MIAYEEVILNTSLNLIKSFSNIKAKLAHMNLKSNKQGNKTRILREECKIFQNSTEKWQSTKPK